MHLCINTFIQHSLFKHIHIIICNNRPLEMCPWHPLTLPRTSQRFLLPQERWRMAFPASVGRMQSGCTPASRHRFQKSVVDPSSQQSTNASSRSLHLSRQRRHAEKYFKSSEKGRQKRCLKRYHICIARRHFCCRTCYLVFMWSQTTCWKTNFSLHSTNCVKPSSCLILLAGVTYVKPVFKLICYSHAPSLNLTRSFHAPRFLL